MERLLGNYRLIKKLGEGNMGEVFKALDLVLEREVAIKLLRPEFMRRPDMVERFRTEAVALARLNHRNVAMLHNFMRHEDQFFMVLEFVRGESLDKVIARRGTIPWQETINLMCQALDGLEHAHRLGVVHRDIKPSNIMITYAGSLKLMDFGIARILERARLTRPGHLIGTLEYMSPEQIQGRDTDARTDIYSLGAVFYEMLTGHPPFEKSCEYSLIKAQVDDLPVPPCSIVPQLPPMLEKAVLRALAKSPDDRFQSAAVFRTELRGLLGQTPGETSYSHPTLLSETRYATTFCGGSVNGSLNMVPALNDFDIMKFRQPAVPRQSRRRQNSHMIWVWRYHWAWLALALLGITVISIVLAYRLSSAPVSLSVPAKEQSLSPPPLEQNPASLSPLPEQNSGSVSPPPLKQDTASISPPPEEGAANVSPPPLEQNPVIVSPPPEQNPASLSPPPVTPIITPLPATIAPASIPEVHQKKAITKRPMQAPASVPTAKLRPKHKYPFYKRSTKLPEYKQPPSYSPFDGGWNSR